MRNISIIISLVNKVLLLALKTCTVLIHTQICTREQRKFFKTKRTVDDLWIFSSMENIIIYCCCSTSLTDSIHFIPWVSRHEIIFALVSFCLNKSYFRESYYFPWLTISDEIHDGMNLELYYNWAVDLFPHRENCLLFKFLKPN